MDVSMAVEVRRRKSGLGHPIDLRQTLGSDIRRIQQAE